MYSQNGNFEWATPDLVSAWHQYDELYRDILHNAPETPGWYADYLLEERDAFGAELARRKRRRLALSTDFTSSVNFLDRDYVKALTGIVDLISESTELRKNSREWRGACPLHGGDNPTSLAVNTEKQVWHCHACQAGGDVFTWIEKLHNVNFVEALKLLAERAGVELLYSNGSHTSDSHKSQRRFVRAPKPKRPEIIRKLE